MNSSSKQNGLKTRNRRKQKNWFLKRIGKNAYLCNSVMNKIITSFIEPETIAEKQRG